MARNTNRNRLIGSFQSRTGTRPTIGPIGTTGAPRAGAGTQTYLGTGINKSRPRTPVAGSRNALARADPTTGQRYKRYLQRDPEGGLRELHVYNVGGQRIVRAFNRLTQPSTGTMARLTGQVTPPYRPPARTGYTTTKKKTRP